jgi:hypothetical protein
MHYIFDRDLKCESEQKSYAIIYLNMNYTSVSKLIISGSL